MAAPCNLTLGSLGDQQQKAEAETAAGCQQPAALGSACTEKRRRGSSGVTREVSAKLGRSGLRRRGPEAAWLPSTCGHPPAPTPELPGEWPQMTGDEVNGATRVHCPKAGGPQFTGGRGEGEYLVTVSGRTPVRTWALPSFAGSQPWGTDQGRSPLRGWFPHCLLSRQGDPGHLLTLHVSLSFSIQGA